MKTRSARWARDFALELWLPLLLVVIWWFASANSTSTYFPPLANILDAFRKDWLDPAGAAQNLLPSLKLLGLGFLLAVFNGVVLGTLFGLVTALERAARPVLEALRAVPGVSLLPIFIVLFGIDETMKILLISFGAFWPIFLNTIDGVRGIEPALLDMGRAFRFSKPRTLFSIILPGAAPQIFAGARTSLAISLIIMVVAETVGGQDGIGYFLLNAQRNFAIKSMWGAIVALGVLGYLLNILFRIVERFALRWHYLLQARLENRS